MFQSRPITKIRYCRFPRAYNASDVSINPADYTSIFYVSAANANDGDKYKFDLYCDGSETKLGLGVRKNAACGIIDLYVNGVLDSSGYDMYAASPTGNTTVITLTQPLRAGYNEITFIVNGKNIASTDYQVEFYGVGVF